MTRRDADVDKFNESARRASTRTSSEISTLPADRIDPGTGFRVRKVSKSGQLTLPGPARTAWLLRGGGEVHVAHFGDFVIIVRAGAWSTALERWRLDEQLARSLQADIDSLDLR